MAVLFQKEIVKLKKMIIQLGTVVEESVYHAIEAIMNRDQKLARKVIDGDADVDRMEVEIEEECLKILALHQPVAIDLRFIVAVLKLNSDLERIGDLSVNMAKGAAFLSTQQRVPAPFDFPRMSEIVQNMLRLSLDSLINMRSDTARKVLDMDDEIDEINRDMYTQVQAQIKAQPQNLECLIRMLSVSRYIERIADHTTNIAEDVIYLVDGEIVRHQMAQM